MIIDCTRYVTVVRVTEPMSLGDTGRLARETGGFVWVALSDPSASESNELGAALGVQQLVLDGLLNANLAQVTVRQNVIIQQVSAGAAIAAVVTIIIGISGINFRHMPEFGWMFGYPLAIAIMARTVVVLSSYCKRVGWL
jgi:Mg2+ and Co2+ transporter CorA